MTAAEPAMSRLAAVGYGVRAIPDGSCVVQRIGLPATSCRVSGDDLLSIAVLRDDELHRVLAERRGRR